MLGVSRSYRKLSLAALVHGVSGRMLWFMELADECFAKETGGRRREYRQKPLTFQLPTPFNF